MDYGGCHHLLKELINILNDFIFALLDSEIRVIIIFIKHCLQTNYRSSRIYFTIDRKVLTHRCG